MAKKTNKSAMQLGKVDLTVEERCAATVRSVGGGVNVEWFCQAFEDESDAWEWEVVRATEPDGDLAGLCFVVVVIPGLDGAEDTHEIWVRNPSERG